MIELSIKLGPILPIKIRLTCILFTIMCYGLSGFAQLRLDSIVEGSEHWQVLLDSAHQLYRQGKYIECQNLSSRAMTVYRPEPEEINDRFCLINLLYAKASLKVNEDQRDYVKSREILNQLISNCGLQLSQLDRINAHYNLAELFFSEKNWILARREMDLCLNMINEYKFSDFPKSGEVENINNLFYLIRIGRVVRTSFDDYEGAIGVYEKVLIFYQSLEVDRPDVLVRLLTELGYTYFLLRKYNKALECYKPAWTLVDQPDSKASSFYAYLCSLLGKWHLHQGDFEVARSYFEKGMNRVAIEKTNDYSNHCNNLGFYYDSVKNYQKSAEYFSEGLNYLDAKPKKDLSSSSVQYLYLGRIHIKLNNYQTAIQYFGQDVEILKKIYGGDYYKLLFSYEGLGDAYCLMSQNQVNDSLLNIGLGYYQKALNLIRKLVQNSEDLSLKKKVLLNANTIGSKYLQWTLRQNVTQDQMALHRKGIWEVMEFLHNTLLLQNLLESNALHLNNIPDSLLILLNRISLENNSILYDISEQLKLSDAKPMDTVILNMKNLQRVKEDSVRIIKRFIAEQYPEYGHYQNSLESCTLEELQSQLLPGQTILEFNCTDTILFIFIIKKYETELYTASLHQSLEELIDSFNRGMFGFHLKNYSSGQTYSSLLHGYISAAHQLYKILIEPISQKLTKELIIIPDVRLGDIAFDALLSAVPPNPANFSSFPFLVKSFTIHYNFSATVMNYLRQTRATFGRGKQLMAMAPFYEKDLSKLKLSSSDAIRFGITELPYSGPEVKVIKEYFGTSSRVLLGEDASRSEFLRWAPQYQILHLATHGKANFEDGNLSFVAFKSKDTIRPFELITGIDFQATKLNAELVVLSACETAVGENNPGSGTISIASSIAASGVKSIVASLWKVNDKSTMHLMQNFYKDLNLGKTKSESLRQAKLNYLKASSPSNQHPFYWAGFNLYGDHSAISN